MLRIPSQLPEETETTAEQIIGCAIDVHKVLGPGYREKVYCAALCHEFKLQSIAFEREKRIHVSYKDLKIGGQRVDLIVRGLVLVELKAVERFEPIHQAIVLSYLKTTGLRLGLMINFQRQVLPGGGIKRVVL